jgi:flagellar biogenesis protein FliO
MEIVRESLAVVFVFALLGTALGLLRKKTGRTRSAKGLVESRGKLALTARHSIHLIRIGERNLIVALHPAGVTFLGDTPLAVEDERKEHAAI